MTTAQRKRRSVYGCDDFTARLAAREAALGLAQQHGTNVLVVTQANSATPQHTAPDAAPSEPNVGDMGNRGHDAWGNAYLSKPRLDGAYVARGWYDGRVVYVCGSPAAHVQHWRLDGRGTGCICCHCFPLDAGLYGTRGKPE